MMAVAGSPGIVHALDLALALLHNDALFSKLVFLLDVKVLFSGQLFFRWWRSTDSDSELYFCHSLSIYSFEK
jgi:hypothetical protein